MYMFMILIYGGNLKPFLGTKQIELLCEENGPWMWLLLGTRGLSAQEKEARGFTNADSWVPP